MAHILSSPLHYPVLFNTTQIVTIIKCQPKGSDMAGKHARYNMLERIAVPKCILKTVTLVCANLYAYIFAEFYPQASQDIFDDGGLFLNPVKGWSLNLKTVTANTEVHV